MLVAIKNNQNVSHFLKFPTSEKAIQLLENEYKQLDFLQQFAFESFEIPSAQKQQKGILLANIKPEFCVKNTNLNDNHLRALDEIYEKTLENVVFTDLRSSQEIEANLLIINNIKYSINDLTIDKIKLLAQNLKQLHFKLVACENVNVGLAHKDFTPWNMYADNSKLYIYDWELSEENTSRLLEY